MANGKLKTSPKKKTGNHANNGHAHPNGNGKDVNWVEEWLKKEIKVPGGTSKAAFTKVIRAYLKSWLAAQNIFQTSAKKKHSLKKLKVELKPGTTRTFQVTAFLKPSAKRPTVRPRPGSGGGHMIPHDPPPPPPKDDSL